MHSQSFQDLTQGKSYRRDQRKMQKTLRGNLELIEGFQDQSGSNKNVVAGLTHYIDKDNINFRKPVEQENTLEFEKLITMQNSLDAVKKEWKSRVKDFKIQSEGQTQAFKTCYNKCAKENNVDMKSACKYGCNVGWFANKDSNSRSIGAGNGQDWSKPDENLFQLAESIVGVVEAAVEKVDNSNFISNMNEGFTVKAPMSTSNGELIDPATINPNKPWTNTRRGVYGSVGYGKQRNGSTVNKQRSYETSKINKILSNNPIKIPINSDGFDYITQTWKTKPPTKGADGSMLNTKMDIAIQAKETLKKINIDSLVERMAATNLNAIDIGKEMIQLRETWKKIFQESCERAIGGTSKKFAGHSDKCIGWQNTLEGRSGFYSFKEKQPNEVTRTWKQPSSINNATVPYVVDFSGNISQKPFFSTDTFDLATDKKNMPNGCDTEIPSKQSGWCVCSDNNGGIKYVYADKGHGQFTCNTVCDTTNSDMLNKANGLLYSNPKNWKSAGMGYTKSIKTTGTLQGDADGGPAPDCPTGMTEIKRGNQGAKGYVIPGSSKKKWACNPWQEAEMAMMFWAPPNPEEIVGCTGTMYHNYARDCKYNYPIGHDSETVNNVGKLKMLPTAQQMINKCAGGDSPDAPYGNYDLDLLEIKVLGFVIVKKSAILYEAIKNSYTASNAAALKRTSGGREILKNMVKYKKAFTYLRALKNKENIINGMLEDVTLKRDSTNISYYLWFALAIASAGLVIKKLSN